MTEQTMKIEYELDEIPANDPNRPAIANAAGDGVGVALPEKIQPAQMLSPEQAIALGVELVRLGRILQDAESGNLLGRSLDDA